MSGPGENVHEVSGDITHDRCRWVWIRDAGPSHDGGMLVRDLVDLLVPPVCLACGAPGRDLCAACRRALPWLDGPRCARCGLPGRCGTRCPAAGHAYRFAWAPLAHGGPARALVSALKFRRATAAAGVLGAAIAATAPAALLRDATLVPVPPHPGRRRQRGIDHAALLAEAVACRTGRPVAHSLRREHDGAHQLGAGRDERLRAGRIAVAVVGTPGDRVVLIDDVHTTGATLDACARALNTGGVVSVGALTGVRTLR